jgi:hypothetical protein
LKPGRIVSIQWFRGRLHERGHPFKQGTERRGGLGRSFKDHPAVGFSVDLMLGEAAADVGA